MNRAVEVMKSMEKINLLRRIQGQRAHRELGLYPGQLPVLDYIRKNPDCNQIDIAQKLHVTPATIAISTKRMEKNGLLTKRIDDDNLRCKKLNITELGLAKCEQAAVRFSQCNQDLCEGFTDEEIHALEGYLERILANVARQMGEDPAKLDFAALVAQVKAGEKRGE